MITLRERFSGRLGHTHSYIRPYLIRLATCLALASVFQWPEPAAASLIGDTVSLSQDPSNPTFVSAAPSTASVVDPGSEFTVQFEAPADSGNFFDILTVDVGASWVQVKPTDPILSLGSDAFFTLSSLNWVGEPGRKIVGVSHENVGVSGFDPAGISFGPSSLTWNAAGTYPIGSSITFNLESVQVPEPSTASLSLLSFFALIRHLRQKQRRRSA